MATKSVNLYARIERSHNLHKIISTHLLTWLKTACYIISRTKEDREKEKK